MSWVISKPGESIESLLRRFKKSVERSGILADAKKSEFFEKPSVIKKRKQAASRKRQAKYIKQLAREKDRKGTNKSFKWNKDRTKKIPMPPPSKKYASNNRTNTNRPNANKQTKRVFTKRPTFIRGKKS